MNLEAIMNPVDTPPPSLHHPSTISDLPVELVIEIAEQLSATYSLASLASLNVTCRRIHESTLSVLFRSLVLVTRDSEHNLEAEREVRVTDQENIPKAWNHVR